MRFHAYQNGPQAGWTGYVEGPGWTLFVADDGASYLHRD